MGMKRTAECRQEAVRVALTRKQVSADFGIGFSTWSKWIQQDQKNPEKPSAQTDLEREITELRKEIPSYFGFVSTAQKWLKKALLPLILLGASQPALAGWDGFGENRTWIIEGQVMSVTPDSFILLRPYGGEEDEIIKIHQWGLKVNVGDLTMITLARRLTCAVLYDTGDYLGVDCYLSFFKDANDNPIRTRLPSTRTANGGQLSIIFIFMFGATPECSRDDEIFGAQLEDQSGLHIKCGQNSTATDIGETE